MVEDSRGTSAVCSAGRIESRPSDRLLVEARAAGSACPDAPTLSNRLGVAVLREEWRVVDRWWTDDPVDRRYFDLVLESGQNACVFRDEEAGCWFSQRA